MKQAINIIGTTLLALALVDIIVVMFTMMQIGNGMYTEHISFWDEQIRVIVRSF